MLTKTQTNPKLKYSGVTALQEHLLSGNPITNVEALLLFGVRNLTCEISRLKKKGFFIQRNFVPMARAIQRLNENIVVTPPQNLPTRDIKFSEYRLTR